MEQDQESGSYQPGSLLVSFTATTTFETARRVLSVHGATTSSSSEQRDQLVKRNWLEARVATGTEARVRCALEDTAPVRSTALNATFKLHQ